MLKHGAKEEKLLTLLLARNQPVPDFIAEAPELLPGLKQYVDAFWELHTCRSVFGLGIVGPIPWTAVNEYAIRNGYEGEEFDDLLYHLRSLDEAYLDYVVKERAKGKDNGKPGSIQETDGRNSHEGRATLGRDN